MVFNRSFNGWEILLGTIVLSRVCYDYHSICHAPALYRGRIQHLRTIVNPQVNPSKTLGLDHYLVKYLHSKKRTSMEKI